MGKRRALLGLFAMVTILWPGQASALIATGPTEFPENAPLMITSFLTSEKGTELEFLEVYNSGSVPLTLDEWLVTDTTNVRNLQFAGRSSGGIVEPKTHVVIAKPDIVDGATYQITGWDTAPVVLKPMTNLRLLHAAYRVSDMAIAAKSIDTWMMRSYLTSSYSSTTFETNYRQLYDDGLYLAPELPEGLAVIEIYPYASDCSPFDVSPLCADYVKLINNSPYVIDLEGLVLRTDSSSINRTNANTITLSGVLQSGAVYAVNRTDNGTPLSLTNSGGYVWLEDAWGLRKYESTLAQYESAGSAQQGHAYALDASDGTWRWTSTPQPFGENVITAPISTIVCAEGKYLNPETNRCRTIAEVVNALAACDEGSERNPATNRCRKIATATSTLTPCKEGQERNPETNRCRSIASAIAELLPCDEGSERNPATNRCRKIKSTDMPRADYPVKSTPASAPTTMTWVAIGGVGAVALAYAGWEWRTEIARFGRRLLTSIRR